MSAGELDITIEQGADYYQDFLWLDTDEVPIDLTGYSAKMQIRRSAESDDVLLECSTVNGRIVLGDSNGKVVITIPAVTTAALDFSVGVYDLELTDGSGVITRFLQGNIYLSKEVTR